MKKQLATLANAPLKPGCRVLLRADYNVPVDADGNITDDTRIQADLPTVQYCLNRGAKLIICSHFGRPAGQPDPQFSLKPVAKRLQELLPTVPVTFATDCVGAAVQAQVDALPNGAILLLENTRFYAAETANDPEFSRQLAQLADIFVNDAFGAAHRAHASTVGVTAYLPSYAGFLLEKEVTALSRVLENPERPFTVIIGGKKVEDKMPIVENMVDLADYILLAGKLAGKWNYDTTGKRAQISVAPDAEMDVHPETIAEWRPIIERSKTIFWNGPVGKFEQPQYAVGTQALAAIIEKCDAFSVVGGGDTLAATQGYHFSHASTGGGASLEFVQGKTLPGIACLMKGGN